jgi:DNA repair protein SbcC/Rad50
MHLHQLKLKNIASLRGEHLIDFEQLAAQDLFAITGETGAGKSSLLNAISLAIYGRVYKKQLNQSDLISLGERDGMVELVFSVRGRKYQTRWSSTVRKKDGSLLSAPKLERFIYDITFDPPQVLDTRPEEILSLDFDQFCKTVILNQGEFARFLTASFTERRDILEKLYPSENLESVGSEAKKKFMAAQEVTTRLELQLHGIEEQSLFDPQAAVELRDKYLDQIKNIKDTLNRQRPWAQGIHLLKDWSKKYLETKERLHSGQDNLVEKTADYNSALAAWSQENKLLENFQTEFEKEKPTLEADDQVVRQLEQLIIKLEQKKKQLSLLQDSLNRNDQRIAALTQDISDSTLQLSRLEKEKRLPGLKSFESINWVEWEDFIKSRPLILEKLKNLEEQLEVCKQKGLALAEEDKLLKAHFSDLMKLTEFSQKNSHQRSEELNNYRDRLSRYEAAKERQKTLHNKLTQLTQSQQALHPKIEQQKLIVENHKLQFLVHSLTEHIKTHNLESCPVCHSELSAELMASPPQTVVSQDDLSQLQRSYDNQESQLLMIQDELKILKDIPLAQKSELILLEKSHQELVDYEQKISTIELRLKESRDSWKEIYDKLTDAKLAHTKILNTQKKLMKKFNDLCASEIEYSDSIYSDLLNDRDISRQVKEKGQILSTQNIQILKLQTDQSEIIQSIETLQKEITSEDSELIAKKEFIQKKYPTELPSVILKTKQDFWRTQTHKVQLLQTGMRKKEDLLIETRSNISRIVDQIKQLELLFSENIQELQKIQPIQVSIDSASEMLDPLLSKISQDIKAQEMQEAELTTHLGKISNQLEEDKKRREQKTFLKEKYGLSQKESERWKRLLDVLGNDDMRTFVLSLVESALIKQTNLELTKLCHGRYEIQHSQKKGKLSPEFTIIDHWRDALVRKVSTLSGGETFMVSLAMALALAEMTRGRADIDSFFIDEGFGTLDEDSLEEVMEMLQQVRSRGKQIGLITHVKALSTRLPINLRLKKDSKGNSQTEIVWN